MNEEDFKQLGKKQLASCSEIDRGLKNINKLKKGKRTLPKLREDFLKVLELWNAVKINQEVLLQMKVALPMVYWKRVKEVHNFMVSVSEKIISKFPPERGAFMEWVGDPIPQGETGAPTFGDGEDGDGRGENSSDDSSSEDDGFNNDDNDKKLIIMILKKLAYKENQGYSAVNIQTLVPFEKKLKN